MRDPFHPAYGFPTKVRLQAIRDAEELGVAISSLRNNVSDSSIYRWMKAYGGDKVKLSSQTSEGKL